MSSWLLCARLRKDCQQGKTSTTSIAKTHVITLCQKCLQAGSPSQLCRQYFSRSGGKPHGSFSPARAISRAPSYVLAPPMNPVHHSSASGQMKSVLYDPLILLLIPLASKYMSADTCHNKNEGSRSWCCEHASLVAHRWHAQTCSLGCLLSQRAAHPASPARPWAAISCFGSWQAPQTPPAPSTALPCHPALAKKEGLGQYAAHSPPTPFRKEGFLFRKPTGSH